MEDIDPLGTYSVIRNGVCVSCFTCMVLNSRKVPSIEKSDLEFASTIKQHNVGMSNRLKELDLFMELTVRLTIDPVFQQFLDSDGVLSPLTLPHFSIPS